MKPAIQLKATHLRDRKEIGDAIGTLGSIAEHDLTPAECIALASALRNLATFTEDTGYAKAHRVVGAITTAKISEGRAELAYDALPSFFKW